MVAAGNDGPDSVSSPSTADAALSVGAVDRDESLAGFSSTGPRRTRGGIKPEITGPGVDMTAKVNGTSEVLRTPVGWYLEPELYDVTVHGVNRDGSPGGDLLTVVDIDDGEWYPSDWILFDNGVAELRLPPGRYSFGAIMFGVPTDSSPWQYSETVEPEVSVTGTTSVVLDARKAKRVTIDVQGAPRMSNRSVSLGYVSAAKQPTGFGGWGLDGVLAYETNGWFFATPTKPAETSDFEFSVGSRQVRSR